MAQARKAPHPVAGFRFAGIAAGLRDGAKRLDLALAVADEPVATAAAFTQNALRAAPVELSERRLRQNIAQAVIVNSGSANACTGLEGKQDAESMSQETAAALEVAPGRVLVCSTGVIGTPVPLGSIRAALPALTGDLSADGMPRFAEAIMTTDTRPKWASLRGKVAGRMVTVSGCAKGSGMIAPNMATMLSYVFTDAAIDRRLLRRLWRDVVGETFNAITVDGDTSTNDTAVIMASGLAGNPIIHNIRSRGAPELVTLLGRVCGDLSEQIVSDGEGATRVVEILVRGALNDAEAKRVARQVGESPLVKTAIYGGDPNWGRIGCAIGNAIRRPLGEGIDLFLDRVSFVRKGREVPGAEEKARKVMKQKRYVMLVDLKSGSSEARMLTCDLTEGYIEINAHYRS